MGEVAGPSPAGDANTNEESKGSFFVVPYRRQKPRINWLRGFELSNVVWQFLSSYA